MQDAHAQVPRTFTYQGQLLDNNNQPVSGTHTITLNFYAASGPIITSWTGTTVVTNGIFNLEVGEPGGLSTILDFNQQYFVGISIDGGPEFTQKTKLHSAPYAINTNTVNGFEASATPQAGKLLPLNAQGKIDPSVLPDAGGIETINGVFPTTAGNVNLVAGTGVTIVPDGPSNTITINASNAGGIQKIVAGEGIIGGGTPNVDGEVFISLAPNAITSDMIGAGTITGSKLHPNIAGDGLWQDPLGNLNVGVDNTTIEIVGDQLRIKPNSVGAVQVDPTQVQLRVTGTAPAGSFVTGVNQNGSVNSGTVNVNSTLTRAVVGSDLLLGINLANANTWTAQQNFNGGATATTLNVSGATTTNGITNTGNIATTTFNSTGNSTVGGNLAVTGTSTLTGAVTAGTTLNVTGQTTTNGINNTGAINNTGTLTNTGNATVTGTLNVNGASTLTGVTNNGTLTNNGNIVVTGTSDLRGAVSNSTGNLNLNDNVDVSGVITAPGGNHVLGTVGTDQRVLTINGVNGTNIELQVNGDANITGTTTSANVNATTVTATNVNTANLGGNGGTVNLTTGVNANTQTITGGTYSNYTLNSGNIAVGQTLTNNGTISGGAITNPTLTGGTINNTIIGNTTPAAGTFTTLNSTGLATLNSANVTTTSQFNGLSTFGINPATNGNKVIINGIVSPTPITLSADYELVVNGDAQVTGTMSAANLTSSGTISAPTGAFDNLTTFTPANNSINVNRGLNLNGGAGQNNLVVGGSTTTQGGIINPSTLAQNGAATFATNAVFNGGITDNGTLTQNGNINQTSGNTTLLATTTGALTSTTGTFSGAVTANNYATTGGAFQVNNAGAITGTSLNTGAGAITEVTR
jgi:hypothetical protein